MVKSKLAGIGSSAIWTGNQVPGYQDDVVVDLSGQTSRPSPQLIYIPDSALVNISSLSLTGPNLGFIVSGQLYITNSLTTNSINFNLTTPSEGSPKALVSISAVQFQQSILTVNSNGALLNIQSMNASVGSTVNLASPSQISMFSDFNSVIDNPLFLVSKLVMVAGSQLTLRGQVSFGNVVSTGVISISNSTQLNINSSPSTSTSAINQLTASFSVNNAINLSGNLSIHQISISQTDSISTCNIKGNVQITEPGLLNNTIINLVPKSDLNWTTTGQLNLGPNGGMNIQSEFILDDGQNLIVGSAGINIIGTTGEMILGNLEVSGGDIFIKNGSLILNQTRIQGSVYHNGGIVSSSQNQITIRDDYIQQSNVETSLIVKEMVSQQQYPYITVGRNTQLQGSLFFSVCSPVPTEFSAVVLSTPTLNGTFEHVSILNVGYDDEDYMFSIIPSANKSLTYLEIDFSKTKDKPKLASWKIFLIIFASILSIFLVSFAIIKLVKFIKSRTNSQNDNYRYEYSQINNSNRDNYYY
eukprot:gene8538-10499_t